MTVDAQSRAVEKLEISELPDARAAMSAARCEIDLSPGRAIRPLNFRVGVNFIQFWLSSKLKEKHGFNTPMTQTYEFSAS